jgi:hypothetical protein|tara:strand:- start:136 stop:309 length:174 start_codon:yes stop_codon:yes gene_type:complete
MSTVGPSDLRDFYDEDNELEKNYEKFYDWLKTCPFKWTESNHPTSGMTCINFEIEKE